MPRLVRYIGTELMIVVGTSSSESVFPRLHAKLRQLGADPGIVALVLPAGYAFNHDGTCLYFSAVAVFLAQAVGIDLSIGQQLGLLAILLVTSKGGAGVAGSAIVVLASTLSATGTIPVASVGLILGVHRLLSSAFVPVNVLGNAIATLVMARMERALDVPRFESELRRPLGADIPFDVVDIERRRHEDYRRRSLRERRVQKDPPHESGSRGSSRVCAALTGGSVDSGSQPLERVLHQLLDATRLAHLAINGKHGDAVHDGPHESGHRQDVIAAHHLVTLQRGKGVHERLERAGRLGGQLGVARFRIDEAAEHDAIVRRVRDGEADVRNAH